MLDVAALGELLIDFTCLSTDENGYPTMAAHPGGAPANFLAALAKYGAKTAMLGKVGDDTFGHLLLDTLRRAGIETRGMIAAPRGVHNAGLRHAGRAGRARVRLCPEARRGHLPLIPGDRSFSHR